MRIAMIVLTRSRLRQISSVLLVYKGITTSSGNVFSVETQLLDTKEEKADKYASTIFVLVVIFRFLSVALRKLNGGGMCVRHEALKNLCSDCD
jgi:fucose permease